MLVLLKIPLVYLCMVVWWAIRAEPRDEQPCRAGAGGDRHTSRADAAGRDPRARSPDRARRPAAAAAPAARPAAPVRRGPSMSSRRGRPRATDRRRPTRSRGLLAVASIVLSGIAMGLRPPAPASEAAPALTPRRDPPRARRGAMSARYQTLALNAALFAAFAWVVGMTVAVVTEGPPHVTAAPRPERCYNTSRMAVADQSGPNAAYVAQLFADYLDAPASVPRRVAQDLRRERRPRRERRTPPRPRRPSPRRRHARRRRLLRPHRSRPRRPRSTPSCSAASPPRWRSSRRYRMHGHLAARLDPLGSEPIGRPGARRDAARSRR